jgi:Rieske Fe-S protein
MNSKLSPDTVKRVISEDISDETDVRAATASHQRDFPYDRGEEAQVTRREFCNFLALTSTALFAGTIGFAAKSVIDGKRAPESFAPQRITGAETLSPGSSLNFRYPTEKDTAILIRADDGHYFAYGQKCTHLACPVYYERQRGQMECPCHEGAFDIRTGRVLYGPPPRPLDQILLETREGGEIWAIGRKPGSSSGHS